MPTKENYKQAVREILMQTKELSDQIGKSEDRLPSVSNEDTVWSVREMIKEILKSHGIELKEGE